MRRHLSSRPWTSTWTKAPVSCSGSHGAVVSQARRRTITSPTRTASPGRIVISRAMPLRLLSRPSTATRSFIGVSARMSGGCAGAALPGAFPPPESAGGAAAGGASEGGWGGVGGASTAFSF